MLQISAVSAQLVDKWRQPVSLHGSHACLSPSSASWLSLGHALPPLQGHYPVIAPAWGSTCDAIVVRAHLVACNAPMKSVMKEVGSRATFVPIVYLKASTCMAVHGWQLYSIFRFGEPALTRSAVKWLSSRTVFKNSSWSRRVGLERTIHFHLRTSDSYS